MVLDHLSLFSIPGSRRPHFGKLILEEDTHKLELRSKTDEGETIGNEKTKKIIDLKGKKLLTNCNDGSSDFLGGFVFCNR